VFSACRSTPENPTTLINILFTIIAMIVAKVPLLDF
jgi:hypothetical protein